MLNKDFLLINKNSHNILFEIIDPIIKKFNKDIYQFDKISRFLKGNKDSIYRGNKNNFDKGIVEINDLQNCKIDELFFIPKDDIKRLEFVISKYLFENNYSSTELKLYNYSLMHYQEVKKPRPLHRDSNITKQWKLFIPINYFNKKISGEFWFVERTALTKGDLGMLLKILNIGKIFNYPRKFIFKPKPGNFLLSNQNCLHGDIVTGNHIKKSWIVFHFK